MQKYEQEAVKAVFYAHPDRLQRLIDEGHLRIDLLEDIGLLGKPFPIWSITQCWEEALGYDAAAYRDEKTVADFMARNQKVKAIFQKNFNIEYSPINYQTYWEYFYSEDPEIPDSDIVSPEEAKVLSMMGTTQLDVELYCAVVKFDLPRIKELLKKGANPSAIIDTNDRWDKGAYGRIDSECAFLCTCRLAYAWNAVEEPPLDDNEIGDLVGWAAHESVYRCLEEYATLDKRVTSRPRMSKEIRGYLS